MKRLIYTIFLVAGILIFHSCQNQSIQSVASGDVVKDSVELEFSMNIQHEQTLSTRAAVNMEMHAFLFDEHGRGVLHKVLSPSNFSFEVPYNTERNSLHFVWVEEGFEQDINREFEPDEFLGVLEGEFINQISSTRELFWARVETPPLIHDVDLGQITLLRNKSRISLKNDTPSNNKFRVIGFSIHNKPKKGTIAPYNGESGEFQVGAITEAYPQDLEPIAPMNENGKLLVSDDEVHFTDISSSIDVFERNKSSVDEELYMIVQARFNGKKNYYKLGFYDNKNLRRIDLQRNYHYVISIKEVTQKGYDKLQDAINNAPAENAGLSILLEEYTQISDGYSSLKVDGTAYSFHTSSAQFEVNYSYKSENESAFLQPSIELIQRDFEEVIDPATFAYTHQYDKRTRTHSGVITGLTNPKMPTTRTFVGTVRVRFENLVREINIELGPKRQLQATLFSNGDKVDDRVLIELVVKESDILNNSMLPIDFYIDTHYLYPDTEKGYNSNLDLIYSEGTDHYHYHYTAKEVGMHRIYFKRNLSDKSEIIQVKSDHYQTKDLLLEGNNVVKPYIAQGAIYYQYGKQLPLDANAKIWVEPTDMPRSFWMRGKGQYSFQFDKRRVDANHNVELYAERKDGTTFKSALPFSYFLSARPDVVLLPYDRVSNPYFYYEWGGRLDMRYYTFESSHEGIEIKQNPDASNLVNYARITYSSAIPNDETIYIYAIDDRGSRRYVAETTAAKLKRSQALDFEL